jgi:hypothetical protein
MMEEETKKKKRAPKAYLYKDGVRTVLPEYHGSGKLSALGVWMREHPDGFGKILDMRAVMK